MRRAPPWCSPPSARSSTERGPLADQRPISSNTVSTAASTAAASQPSSLPPRTGPTPARRSCARLGTWSLGGGSGSMTPLYDHPGRASIPLSGPGRGRRPGRPLATASMAPVSHPRRSVYTPAAPARVMAAGRRFGAWGLVAFFRWVAAVVGRSRQRGLPLGMAWTLLYFRAHAIPYGPPGQRIGARRPSSAWLGEQHLKPTLWRK